MVEKKTRPMSRQEAGRKGAAVRWGKKYIEGGSSASKSRYGHAETKTSKMAHRTSRPLEREQKRTTTTRQDASRRASLAFERADERPRRSSSPKLKDDRRISSSRSISSNRSSSMDRYHHEYPRESERRRGEPMPARHHLHESREMEHHRGHFPYREEELHRYADRRPLEETRYREPSSRARASSSRAPQSSQRQSSERRSYQTAQPREYYRAPATRSHRGRSYDE